MSQNTNIEPIKKTVMVIHQMSEDEKTRELAWFREKALHDEAALLYESKQEGREEGRAESNAEWTEKLRRAGYSDEEINRIINL